MSNPPSHDESTSAEPPADVFARLTEVPLDLVDKVIEATESSYTDLNKVRDHPYWGDVVLRQGAAVRALREAREELDALRSEAVGARNTELGITVATGVGDGERSYANDRRDKSALVDSLLRPRREGSACHLYVWDRPYENEELPGPYQQIRVVTAVDDGVGVLNLSEETEDGELRSWHSHNPDPPAEAPVLRFDAGSPLTFPKDAVLPLERVRAALAEFADTGLRPTTVEWQQARWGQ